MNLRYALSTMSLLLVSGAAAYAQAPTSYTFDVNGSGSIQNIANPFVLIPDPGTYPGGILTFNLLAPVTAGDLWINTGPPAGPAVISDVLRFTGGPTAQLFVAPGLPAPAYGNVVTVPVAVGGAGVIFTPSAGQPGFDPAAGLGGTSYFVVTAPVPETSSVVSLGLLLALGLGGAAITARKRSRASR